MELPTKLEFLKSERFWALVIGAASTVLIDPSTSTQPWYVTLGKFLGIIAAGFITIGTVDRVGKNIGGVVPSVTEQEEETEENKTKNKK